MSRRCTKTNLTGNNESVQLLKEYRIETDMEVIRLMTNTKWKAVTGKAVKEAALDMLYKECKSKSKTANIPIYLDLKQQPYFQFLSPSKARTYFQVRAKVFDLKCYRPYMYNNERCRLCGSDKEDLDHVINQREPTPV